MANIYTWTIVEMACCTTQTNPNTVVTVHWACAGTDGTYNAAVYSTCNVPLPTETFTPYADLTQEQALGWIWNNGVDKDGTEKTISQQLINLANPPVVTPPLPWIA